MHKILIVGGGLGGLSAAIELAKAGCQVRLVERNNEWTALGAGLTFNGATARAFRTIGVFDEVLAAGSVHGSSDVCDREGNIIFPGSDEEIYGLGIPVLGGILRPVLHAIFCKAAMAAGVEGLTGTTVADWRQDRDRVTAVLSDGSRDSYDLAIGADGLMSHTRRQLFPDAPQPVFTGQGCWRAVAPRPKSLTTSALYMGGRHKAGLNPVSDDQMYLFLLVTVPDNPWYDEDRWPELLREELSEFGGDIGYLRDHLSPDSQINYRPLETIVMPPPWHSGRVLLIGDAAHATTPHVGFGAGLAIEDGVVLGELVRSGMPIPELLGAFVERRYERCASVVDGSIALGRMEMECAPIELQRNLSREIYDQIRMPA